MTGMECGDGEETSRQVLRILACQRTSLLAVAMAASLAERGPELYAKNLEFVEEEIKIYDELRPSLATPNAVRLDLRTMKLRDCGKPVGISALVDAPHGGHAAVAARYYSRRDLGESSWRSGRTATSASVAPRRRRAAPSKTRRPIP